MQRETTMNGIDPMHNLVRTILDNRKLIFFLGAGASIEGTQDGKPFPSFSELIERILEDFGKVPKKQKKRFDLFLEIIKKWQNENRLSIRLKKYLGGNPGPAHFYLAALSIALYGECNALLYLTTNYDNLINTAFEKLEINPVRTFDTVSPSVRPNILGNEFLNMEGNIIGQLNEGHPVIFKLFGDLNFENPIFRQEEMKFQPLVEDKLIEWMKKPMVFIGYSFSDRIINQLLYASRGNFPVFIVNPYLSPKIKTLSKDLDRVKFIQNDFSGFIHNLLKIFEQQKPEIRSNIDEILTSARVVPQLQPTATLPLNKSHKIELGEVKKILILASNPQATPRLQLEKEVRDIEEGLRRAKKCDQFEIHSKWAVGIKDFRRALLDHDPHIVHFTGHGKEAGLIVEDELGFPTHIPSQALGSLFKLWSQQVECVVLISCYSESQAKVICNHIPYVIGMKKEIDDDAAIEFSVGFYDALGAGWSYEKAFEMGKSSIQMKFPDLTEHQIPKLKKGNPNKGN